MAITDFENFENFKIIRLNMYFEKCTPPKKVFFTQNRNICDDAIQMSFAKKSSQYVQIWQSYAIFLFHYVHITSNQNNTMLFLPPLDVVSQNK